jgi:hypothetical protein
VAVASGGSAGDPSSVQADAVGQAEDGGSTDVPVEAFSD